MLPRFRRDSALRLPYKPLVVTEGAYDSLLAAHRAKKTSVQPLSAMSACM